MAKVKSRILDKGRVYEGENVALLLINWLNLNKHEQAKQRIKRVIALFWDYWSQRLAYESLAPTPVGKAQSKERRTAERKLTESSAALDDALSFYQTTPWVNVSPRYGKDGRQKGFGVTVGSQPVVGSALAQSVKLSSKDEKLSEVLENPLESVLTLGSTMHETGAIHYLLEIMRSGHISRLRSCRCQNYFFQRFAHQRFCSEKCRIADFRTTDEARQKRNSYARKLYQLHKTKNVK